MAESNSASTPNRTRTRSVSQQLLQLIYHQPKASPVQNSTAELYQGPNTYLFSHKFTAFLKGRTGMPSRSVLAMLRVFLPLRAGYQPQDALYYQQPGCEVEAEMNRHRIPCGRSHYPDKGHV
jgi:hypothetical protein